MQLLTIMLVPHAFTGNWYIAKEGVESTGPQGGSLPPRKLTESRLSRGRVTSLDTTTTNWPSRIHWTVTGPKVQEEVNSDNLCNKNSKPENAYLPSIVTLLSVNAAVDSFTLSTTDPRLSTRDLRIISYSTFIKGLCQHHWLLKLQRKMLVSLKLNWLLKPLVWLLLNLLLNRWSGCCWTSFWNRWSGCCWTGFWNRWSGCCWTGFETAGRVLWLASEPLVGLLLNWLLNRWSGCCWTGFWNRWSGCCWTGFWNRWVVCCWTGFWNHVSVCCWTASEPLVGLLLKLGFWKPLGLVAVELASETAGRVCCWRLASENRWSGLLLNWLLKPLVGGGLLLNWLLNRWSGLLLNWLLKPWVGVLLNWLLKPRGRVAVELAFWNRWSALLWTGFWNRWSGLLLKLLPEPWSVCCWTGFWNHWSVAVELASETAGRLLLNWLLKPLVRLLLNWLLKPLVRLLLNWLLKPLV